MPIAPLHVIRTRIRFAITHSTRTAYVLIVTASILAAVLAIIYTTMVAKNAAAAAAAGNAVAVVTPGRLGRADPSSYAVPEEVRHQHIALNWTVDFERQTIGGKATYTFQVQGNQAIKQIVSVVMLLLSHIS